MKPTPYLAIYEQLLVERRRQGFALLELGVWKGDSLEMWRDAFPRASIVGLDLNPPDIELGPRVHIVAGDQTDASLLRRVREEHAPEGFEVIIDDASHLGVVTARSLQILYREHLRPGGLYVIEDWGTGYLPDWPDGKRLPGALDVANLEGDGDQIAAGHDAGMVGLIKRLIDHTAAGTVGYGQPDQLGEALPIEKMEIWDGVVVLRKPIR